MSDTAKDRHLRCFFGILNLCGLMDTDDYADDKKEIIYSEVRLPLFSHQTYTIKTTFNRNFTYKDTNIKDDSGNDIIDEFGNPIKKTSDNFATIYTPSLGENETHLLQSYEGKYYQKKFRREVLWDFGDGTKKEGYSAEHHYKKPGRYKITCTFFDINRKAWVNDYCIYVVVKEILPTILRFDKSQTKTDIKCSKIEKIARLEALNSNTIKDDLIVNVKRIFNEKEHEDNYEEIGNDYKSLLPNTFKFMEKYWTLLENKQTLFYNSDVVHSDYLMPTETFTPKYNQIYGKFYYDELNDCMGISLYQVIPYKNIDENLKTIELLNPNANILSSTEEEYQQYSITHVYTQDQLPDGVFPVGKRGWFDIFYRNDFTGNDNVFSIFYEIEKKNITGELETASNYLNINPLGLTIKVSENDISNIRVGVSLDGFLRPLDGENIKDARYFIDQHLYNSLFKGIDLDIYIFPYIPYQKGQESFEVNENMYYVPKDVTMTVYPEVKTIGGNSRFSFINHGGYIIDGNIVQTPFDDYIVGIHPWFYRIPLILRNYINIKFTNVLSNDTSSIGIELSLIKKSLSNTQNVIIPKEKYNKEDVERLLDVYMGHPMFNNLEGEKTLSQNGKVQLVPGKSKIRQLFEAVLGNGFLNDILTSSDNFLDNTSNVKRCYLSNLISMLQMMGEDVTLFEKGAFEGINDLKNFVRFLSMNHTELIGHKVNKELDIRVQKDLRGANVGEQISLDDVLYLRNTYNSNPVDSKNSQYIEDNLGKIYKVKFENKKEALINHINGVDLIVHDRYTNDTKVVSFNPLQVGLKNKNKEMLSEIKIADYDESWGWNLLLPDSFTNINKKVKELSKRIDELTNKIEEMETSQNSRGVRLYSLSQIDVYRDELKKTTQEKARLQQIARDLIDGYYTFHLLNPYVDQERVGNFIDGKYISERIENVDDWNETWGITHEILMKILFENGYLYNGRQFNDDGDDGSFNVTHINIHKSFKNEVDYTVIVDDNKNYEAKGIVTLFGDILDEGDNTLTVSLRDGLLNDVDNFYMLNDNFEVNVDGNGNFVDGNGNFVDENGNFITKSQTYDVFGERVSGSITITISGTISQPIVEVSSVLNYNPIIVSGGIDVDTEFECIVYKNGSIITNPVVKGSAKFVGTINGTGSNKVVASIPELKKYQDGDDVGVDWKDFVSNNNRSVEIFVNKQGEIDEKTIKFDIRCDYDDDTECFGNVVVTIGGTVKNPICTANGEFNLRTKQDLLPDFYQEKVFDNTNLNQKIKVYTYYDGATQDFVEVSYLIKQFKCVLTRQDNTKNYDVNVEFDLQSLDYTPIIVYETWRTDAKCTKQLEVTVNSSGEITPVDFYVQLTLGKDAKPIFGQFLCNISGNILTNDVQITLTQHEQFKGYYSYLFDFDKVYLKGTRGFIFENFDSGEFEAVEAVRIYTHRGKKLYFEPIVENNKVDLTFKVEYIYSQNINGGAVNKIVYAYEVPYTLDTGFEIDTEGKIHHNKINCNIIVANEEKYYSIENDFTISSRSGGSLISSKIPYEVTSFVSKYLTKVISVQKSYNWTDFVSNEFITGGFGVDVQGIKGQKGTIKLTLNLTKYGEIQIEPIDGINPITIGDISIDDDGNMRAQSVSVHLTKEVDNVTYTLQGDVIVKLVDGNLEVSTNNLQVVVNDANVKVNERRNWTDFNISGLDEHTVTGGFEVDVQGVKDQTGTIKLTLDLTKYGEIQIEPVDGVNPIIISNIPIDKYGNMGEQSVSVHLSNEIDNVTYTLQGDIIIELVNGNLEVSTNNLQVVVDDKNINVNGSYKWTDFNISGLDGHAINGGFDVSVNGIRGNNGTSTLTIHQTTIDNIIVNSNSVIPKPIYIYENGDSSDVLHNLNLTKEVDNVTYTLQGDVIIELVKGNLEVSTSNLQVVVNDANVKVNESRNWTDFNISGLDGHTVTGGFEVTGNGIKEQEMTIRVSLDNITIDNEINISPDQKNIDIVVIPDENGDFDDKEVKFNYYNEAGDFEYSLKGTIYISRKDNTVEITSPDIVLTVEEILLYIDYDEYGNVVDYDVSKMTRGNNVFAGSSITTFDGDLSSLTDGHYMFRNCDSLTSFDSDLSRSLDDGQGMFYGSSLTSFSGDLSSLTDGNDMFRYCNFLTSFDSDLSSLINGCYMFYSCISLTSFRGDFSSSFIDGRYMFNNCISLESFNGDLSSLINGSDMFVSTSLTSFSDKLSKLEIGIRMFSYCDSLTSFNSDLNNLTDGNDMFYYCDSLTSFNADLGVLTNGNGMFSHCTSLESFSGDLSSLDNGAQMFSGCKLNKDSVTNIITCLKEKNTRDAASRLTLGIASSLKNDTDLQTLLGITEAGATSTTLTGAGGGTWTIGLEWN